MGRTEMIGTLKSLLDARRYGEAARLLTDAADAGDPDALGELAHWRIAGNLLRRDLAEAGALLGRAGAAGNRQAALLHASFLAAGTGGPSEWAAGCAALADLAPFEPRATTQLRMLESMDLGPDGSPAQPIEGHQLSEAPLVLACEQFMSRAECAYLAELGGPALQPSLVVDPATGRMIPHPVRSSDAAMFGVFTEDLVVNALNRRIAALSRTHLTQGEPLQLLRYRPGGEYRAHSDALSAEANQRILTVLVYLSDGYAGGETVFPRVGLSFRGKVGDALLFRNVTSDGGPDPLALHAGLPVTKGTKLIASRWIRQEPFTFPPPTPLLGDNFN